MHKNNDAVGKIKELAVLSDIMGEHIKLRKSGRNITCCCPFHDDRSPSMSISDERGFYHCFGCGASGDVFSFLQEYLGMDFRTALRELANRYGVVLERREVKKLANEALILLQERFVSELAKNAAALRYLNERGLSASSIANFNLGYAPSNAATLRALENAQIPPIDALKQGAVKERDGALYASFIERITFPIYDENGDLRGFGGRTMNPNNPAKYVNSPACELFDKKRILYGYFAAKAAVRREKMLLICEGYMDVIAFHQAGITHAAAALGVALGAEHLRLIPRGVFVRLCFDSDRAGQTAAFRAAVLLAQNGYNGDVINLQPYKDAGEFVQQHKERELAEAASLAGQNIIAFAMDYIFKQELNISQLHEHASTDPFLKRAAILAVMEFAKSIDKFLASQHLELFSKRAQIDLNDFAQDLSAQTAVQNRQTAVQNRDGHAAVQNPQQPTLAQINPLEASVLHFLYSCRKDFSELIFPQLFIASELAAELKNCCFESPAVMEFAQFMQGKKVINIVGFLHNLSRIYQASARGSKAQLYQRFCAALVANERLILSSNERLKAAYLLLFDINAFSEQSAELAAQIASKINKLGDQ